MAAKIISDKDLYDSIVNLIKKSQTSLIISSPWIHSCDHLLDEIINAKRRGVRIIVIMRQPDDVRDRNYYKEELFALKKLKDAEAKIAFDPHVHEKVIISDGKEMIVSSVNLTGISLTRSGESGTYMNDVREIGKYKTRLSRKYKEIEIPTETSESSGEISIQSIIKNHLHLIVYAILLLFIVILLFSNQSGVYTVSRLLEEHPLNQIVSVSGSVIDTPKDNSANTYQYFYITDHSSKIRISCFKDKELKVDANDIVELTGKFIIFRGKYQVEDLKCSDVKIK